ncbi:S41 family peptidase [Paucibacter sp. APW11]|uniref:S41 family peptidase n=1 Tax=Roseateles aquae TaxID=3077235 RepID=A0ABU3PCV2_9BURK|nr:S41 family peptidase [Paucibacter sp. APW11]MDT9000140.1 S41 family peptidase [Paucibacter sp. APW11]
MRKAKNSSGRQQTRRLGCAALLLALVACGGGGGSPGNSVFGDGGVSTGTGSSNNNNPGTSTLPSSASLAQQCAPANSYAAASQRTGSLSIEKQWLRSYFDEAYLWRDQVPSVNANASDFNGSDVYVALRNYFDALKTPQLTESGAHRDKFSFIYPTEAWNLLSQQGVDLGYGLDWSLQSGNGTRTVRIAYLEPSGIAADAGLRRGDELSSVDGISANANDQGSIDKLNAALFPATSGERHRFVFVRPGVGEFSVELSSAQLSKQPVLSQQVINTADGQRVGHIVFNDHIAPAEAQLIAAINSFKQQAVSDLVLDLRYNGGGYLFIASELAYMVAGPTQTNGQLFEQLRYNDRRTADNSSASSRTPFYSESCLLGAGGCSAPQPLPTLGLKRVFVLAQSGTCSASESIINGLRGVGVQVILIGGQTCGKPYGFTAKDNCGISYFPIEFVGTNAKGFGDYADGFVPGGNGVAGVPGCQVADDFNHALGDTQEAMLAAALSYRSSGQCPAGSVMTMRPQSARPLLSLLQRPPQRSNRIYRAR